MHFQQSNENHELDVSRMCAIKSSWKGQRSHLKKKKLLKFSLGVRFSTEEWAIDAWRLAGLTDHDSLIMTPMSDDRIWRFTGLVQQTCA